MSCTTRSRIFTLYGSPVFPRHRENKRDKETHRWLFNTKIFVFCHRVFNTCIFSSVGSSFRTAGNKTNHLWKFQTGRTLRVPKGYRRSSQSYLATAIVQTFRRPIAFFTSTSSNSGSQNVPTFFKIDYLPLTIPCCSNCLDLFFYVC